MGHIFTRCCTVISDSDRGVATTLVGNYSVESDGRVGIQYDTPGTPGGDFSKGIQAYYTWLH